MNGAVSNLSVAPSAIATLGRELRHGGYDVVHVHEPNAPVVSWYAVEAARSPVVGTFHCYSTSGLSNNVAALVGARRLYNKLHMRIAVSEAARWTAQRFYGGRYRIVPNGVDLAAARPNGARPTSQLQLLFLGRAEERKGLPVLLRAYEGLRALGVDARLTVAGATRDEVQPFLLDAEGIEIAGRVTDDEKWRAARRCRPALRAVARRRELRHGADGGVRLRHARRVLRHRRLPRRRPRRPRRRARPAGRRHRARRGAPRARRRSRRGARDGRGHARERAERFAWPQRGRARSM